MLHPLLHLIATQPHLLAEHAQAYAELVTVEIGTAGTAWKRRLLLSAVALFFLVVAAVLAGVALMLWAVIPAAHVQASWVLIAAPLLPVAAAVGCLLAARVHSASNAFDNLRQQVKADVAMLREVSAGSS